MDAGFKKIVSFWRCCSRQIIHLYGIVELKFVIVLYGRGQSHGCMVDRCKDRKRRNEMVVLAALNVVGFI
jgi:hypothetical protein